MENEKNIVLLFKLEINTIQHVKRFLVELFPTSLKNELTPKKNGTIIKYRENMSSFLDEDLFDPGTVVVNPLITQTTTIQIVLGQGQRLFDIDIENLVVKQCDGMKIITNIVIVNTNRTKL